VAYYGSSLATSVLVDLALQERGWKRQERRTGTQWNEPGTVRVVLAHDNGRTVEATGSPDEALCRAALKAVEKASSEL
jgi:hypothetical protein